MMATTKSSRSSCSPSSKGVRDGMAAALASIGYAGDPFKLTEAAKRNPKLLAFVEWVTRQITPGNQVSLEQSQAYEKLRSEGKVLEGRVLQDTVDKLRQGSGKMVNLEKDIERTRAQSAALKGQLQTLNSVHHSLSDHYADLLHERDKLSRQKSDMKRRCHEAQQEVAGKHKMVDRALEDLCSAVKDLCGGHRRAYQQEREGVNGHHSSSSSPAALHLLSNVNQDMYHKSEDQYLAQLIDHTKKQFFKGIAEVALAQAPGEGDYQFSPVDLDDSEEVILRGVSEDQYRLHQWELHRLQTVYPVLEMQYINAVLAHRHAQAATIRAKQELELLNHTPSSQMEEESLRHQVAERQQRVCELQAMLEGCGQDKLSDLLQEMAALQVTRVLHGDYDLKIARQDAFISKQDQVISCLQSQQSRHELLAMLYEVELRRHRDTHRLLATTEHQLNQLKDSSKQRSELMQDPALKKAVSRTTLESSDVLAQELCAVLGLKAEGVVPLLTQDGLLEAVKKLCQQVAMLDGVMSASDKEISHLLDTQDSLTCQLERELFQGSDHTAMGVPVLCVQEYVDQCADLTTLINALEEDVKLLVKDYDKKKKLLKADPLLESEKKLFIHFFTNPSQLGQVLGNLAKRIDSITLAS